ncbi:MAG: presenilin family intramembrane aspartyl protease [Candidatus Woesearchaeota archaeon]|nr:presenilin family intramembrane aspartyl protease [Candidatus Woesearchaeota archaeon]
MKHNLKITLLLVLFFFLAQIIGLAIMNQYVHVQQTSYFNETLNETVIIKNITLKELPAGIERPEIEPNVSIIYIGSAILVGTIILLVLIKFKKTNLWKLWFFFSVLLTLTVAFTAFMDAWLAFLLSLVLSIFKVYRPNIYIHNLTELFIYGGIAAIFVPIMNLFAVFILLILISLYDMFAVWQSKHMITMANFQTESKLFAGLSIPYNRIKEAKKTENIKGEAKKLKMAILGGGDIAFPLLFAGVLLQNFSFLKVLIIPVVVSIALFLLFVFAKKDRFYPAMPFLTAGCLLGYFIIWLI